MFVPCASAKDRLSIKAIIPTANCVHTFNSDVLPIGDLFIKGVHMIGQEVTNIIRLTLMFRYL